MGVNAVITNSCFITTMALFINSLLKHKSKQSTTKNTSEKCFATKNVNEKNFKQYFCHQIHAYSHFFVCITKIIEYLQIHVHSYIYT